MVSGNTFDGHAAGSWVGVEGGDYSFTGNTGTGTALAGYTVSGCGNVWRDNRSDLGGAGEYAINVTAQPDCAAYPNVVYASNTVAGATKGLTNITVAAG